MPALTYRLANAADSGYQRMVEADQTAATLTSGWTVGKLAAVQSCNYAQSVKQPTTSFSDNGTSAKPVAPNASTNANGFRSQNPITGTFANTNWTLTVVWRSVTAAHTGTLRARIRVFKGANADGAGATELTGSTQVGATSGAGSTSADVSSAVTWSPGAVLTFNNEYLFVTVAIEVVTASGSNTADALLRTGSAATTGTRVLTSVFNPTDAATVGLALTPSSAEAYGTTDTTTVTLLFVPSAVEGIHHQDSSIVGLLLRPSATPEVAVFADTSTDVPSFFGRFSPTVVDDFNRANENLDASSNWDIIDPANDPLFVDSNEVLYTIADSGISTSYWTPQQYSDVDVMVDIKTPDGLATGPIVCARVQNPGSSSWTGYYVIWVDSGNIELHRKDASSDVLLGFNPAGDLPALPAKLGIRCVGNRIQGWFSNGGAPIEWEDHLLDVFDNNYGSGYAGLGGTSDIVRLDNFRVGAPVILTSFTLNLTPSGSDTHTQDTNQDAATILLSLTPSGSDIQEVIDAATVALSLTPSSADVATYVDQATALLSLTPSGTEFPAREEVDAGTIVLRFTPTSADTSQDVDSVTVGLAFTPSGVESRQITDSGNVSLVFTPSTTDVSIFVDVNTVLLTFSISSADTAQFVEAATTLLTLTPSGTDEFGIPSPTDAATGVLKLTPSSTDVAIFVNASTISLLFTPSSVELTTFIDSATGLVALNPTSTNETAQYADSTTGRISFTPSSLDFREVPDQAIAVVTFIPSASEVSVYSDLATGTVTFTPSSVDLPELTDTGTALLSLFPSGTDTFIPLIAPPAHDFRLTATTRWYITVIGNYPADEIDRWSAHVKNRARL